MSDEQHDTIDALASENRTFPPTNAFKATTLVAGTELYDEANADDEAFWERQASELVEWFEPWNTVLDWQLPYAKWFEGGTLNVAHNCLDRHVNAGNGGRVAIHWEGEPGDTRTITYQDLL
ncbi:MAG: acetyl-CoA synthetase, partial [Minisyncoccia bacterium]